MVKNTNLYIKAFKKETTAIDALEEFTDKLILEL